MKPGCRTNRMYIPHVWAQRDLYCHKSGSIRARASFPTIWASSPTSSTCRTADQRSYHILLASKHEKRLHSIDPMQSRLFSLQLAWQLGKESRVESPVGILDSTTMAKAMRKACAFSRNPKSSRAPVVSGISDLSGPHAVIALKSPCQAGW